MKVVILAGGRGTRMRVGTGDFDQPKVLFEVGSRPLIWHLMKLFRVQGFDDFVLCLGHKAALVRQSILDSAVAAGGTAQRVDGLPAVSVFDPLERWRALLLDTGADTNTGGRVRQALPIVGDSTFMVTYGDGLADIDLTGLLRFHRRHGRVATLTAVRPRSQFGLLSIGDDGGVKRFREQPRLRSWVNGGFFVFEPSLSRHLCEDSVLEIDAFHQLAQQGELMAYRHDGFWHCIDTYKDLASLNDIWSSGSAPWRHWD